jgi:hypothetical protein
METKFLTLRHSVDFGSRFDDWQVCWLGGWDKHQHFYLVMLVKVTCKKTRKQKTPPGKIPGGIRLDQRRFRPRRNRFALRRRPWSR